MGKAAILRLVKRALLSRGYAVLPLSQLNALNGQAALAMKAASFGMLDDAGLRRAVDLADRSMSQLNQDFFVLHALGWKRDGFFVEFGATDGRTLSNSWLLETEFGWRGILAEPARHWRDALWAAGRTAALDFDCVWSRTGERLRFSEASWPELSTLAASEGDFHAREVATSYEVTTVSLNDLLDRHGAPAVVDYLSLDTEGSEYEILAAVDFGRHAFRCITCEHNFGPQREAIHELLTANGYERKFEAISRFDDWYLRAA
jgi:FkbM family methyltransferase